LFELFSMIRPYLENIIIFPALDSGSVTVTAGSDGPGGCSGRLQAGSGTRPGSAGAAILRPLTWHGASDSLTISHRVTGPRLGLRRQLRLLRSESVPRWPGARAGPGTGHTPSPVRRGVTVAAPSLAGSGSVTVTISHHVTGLRRLLPRRAAAAHS
jgi:hypothetical protein